MIRTIIQIQGTSEGIRVFVTLKDGGRRVARVLQDGLSQKDVGAAIDAAVEKAKEIAELGKV